MTFVTLNREARIAQHIVRERRPLRNETRRDADKLLRGL